SGHTAKIPLTKDMADLVKHTATQILRIYKGWTPPPPPPHPPHNGLSLLTKRTNYGRVNKRGEEEL
ncbi:MAG: hypothetical protein QXQ31_06410, partial [Zestosphaera sp.]